MNNSQDLLNEVVHNPTLWVQLDDESRILNWGNTEVFEGDGYIPIPMPQDEFFFKRLGDMVEYGHKYYKVVEGQAVLNTDEFKEIPEGCGIVRFTEDGVLYFDTRKFMAKTEEIVHEVIYENNEFYYVEDGELKFDEEAQKFKQQQEEERLIREYRNYMLLPAFDKWERTVLVGRANTSKEVYDWYYSILDLSVEHINNVPEPILYYLKDCQLSTF